MTAAAVFAAAVVLHAAAAVPALTASPARVVLDGTGQATVRVAAPRGTELVDVALAPYGLDLRGRPRLGGQARPPGWVSANPRVLRVGPKGAVVRLSAAPPRGAAPGDHPFALVLTTRRAGGSGVGVRLRVGVLVLARVPGRIVRRLIIGPVRVRRAGANRTLELAIRNSGNVVERLAPGRLVLAVLRRGRVLARLYPPGRELLPRSRASIAVRFHGRVHGAASVRVTFGPFTHVYAVRL